MTVDPATGPQPGSVRTPSLPETQAGRMRAAVDQAVAIAPGFLRGDVDAEQMTRTMVKAVRDYVEQEQSADRHGAVSWSPEVQTLQNALAELMTCGSGYLAGRCDADCVARTMTEMVREFRTS